MTRSFCISILFMLVCMNLSSQNMQILYGFDQLPQTLILNPGEEVDYKSHIGVPLLSGVYADFGSSNRSVTYNSVLANTDRAQDAIRNLYALDLKATDIFSVNQRIEVLSAGFRLSDPSYYLSFGMYQEINMFSTYPKDFTDVFFNGDDQDGDGIPETIDDGVVYGSEHMNTVGELVGVFHIGLNKKLNDKWTLGARFKLLSGSIGIETKKNKGNYYLSELQPPFDPYLHNFEDVDVVLNTSGLLDPFDLSSVVGDPDEVIAAMFFVGGNIGAALDLGFTHHLNEDWELTGSLLDLGLVNYSQKLSEIELFDDLISSETFYDPPYDGELDYWQEAKINGEIPLEAIAEGYMQLRSPKLNAALKYTTKRLTKDRNSAYRNLSCDTNIYNETLESSLGVQVYNEFRPQNNLWAITGFYSRQITRYLSAKATYTYDKFSAKNIGLGFALYIKSFNLYATADNLLDLPDVRNSNYQSFQFGMNVILN